ncbi:MAG: hypothetical protein QXX38_02800 [Candidatus Aenigmatarchaeota archaeon]
MEKTSKLNIDTLLLFSFLFIILSSLNLYPLTLIGCGGFGVGGCVSALEFRSLITVLLNGFHWKESIPDASQEHIANPVFLLVYLILGLAIFKISPYLLEKILENKKNIIEFLLPTKLKLLLFFLGVLAMSQLWFYRDIWYTLPILPFYIFQFYVLCPITFGMLVGSAQISDLVYQLFFQIPKEYIDTCITSPSTIVIMYLLEWYLSSAIVASFISSILKRCRRLKK